MRRAFMSAALLACVACGGASDNSDDAEARPAKTSKSATTASAAAAEPPKTVADYEADVEASTDPDNLEAEVAKLEKEVAGD